MKLRRMLSVLLVLAIIGTLFAFNFTTQKAGAAFGDRITVSGTQFFAGGSRIWINGCNTPWDNWDDFGGSYDSAWWTSHFQSLHDNGVNASRVWIVCSGNVGINIATDGTVSGATAAHWSNLDSFFSIAASKQIYIMATLMSFDCFNSANANYSRWRNMINSDTKIDSYVNNYVIPFVNRYKNNNYLWSIDLCNEGDWIYENSACGNIPWARIQKLFGKMAVGIHANSSILVTAGIAMIKYNSDAAGMNGNMVSNSALQAQVADSRAKLDFYSPHFYDWMAQYWGTPFYMTPVAYGLTDTSKPPMIGECAALGTSGHTLTQDYETGYSNGWQGAMAWTSNGVDACGGFNDLTPATNAFKNNHYSLVFPGGGATPTPTPAATATPTPAATPTPTPAATPTPTPAATPTPGGTYTIYGDALASDWENWSWNDTINFSATTKYSGTYSISNTFTSSNAGLSLRKGTAQSTSGYTRVKFWVKSTTGTKAMTFYTGNLDEGGTTSSVGFNATTTWTEINVALSSIGNPSTIKRVYFVNNTGTTTDAIYIDDIRLTN